jgi:hypothetical protein
MLLSLNAQAEPLVHTSCQTFGPEGALVLGVEQLPNGEAQGSLQVGKSVLPFKGKFAITSQDALGSQTSYQLIDANAAKMELTITKKLNLKKFCGRGGCDYMKIVGNLSYLYASYHFPACHEN